MLSLTVHQGNCKSLHAVLSGLVSGTERDLSAKLSNQTQHHINIWPLHLLQTQPTSIKSHKSDVCTLGLSQQCTYVKKLLAIKGKHPALN